MLTTLLKQQMRTSVSTADHTSKKAGTIALPMLWVTMGMASTYVSDKDHIAMSGRGQLNFDPQPPVFDVVVIAGLVSQGKLRNASRCCF